MLLPKPDFTLVAMIILLIFSCGHGNFVTYHSCLGIFFAHKYSKFNLILQVVLSHFDLMSCKQQREGETWLKTQMKKVISMVRK